MWELTEILRSGSMIVISIALIVIVQKVASYFRRNSIELNEVTDLHCWSNLDTLLKTYTCNVCDSFLTGNSGKECDNCGVCCHDACIKLAENNRRCKDVYSLNVRQSVHHWVKGGNLLEVENLEVFDVTCTVCGKECDDNEIGVSQCCWCQKVIHSTCILSTSANECDYGKFRKFIIPPFCVTPWKPAVKPRRKFKIKELSHPGWSDWSPVFVLANRRAGNSDGAHILSYFRRMMNPCQILDLSVHSPLLILKWCSLIPVGVKFYVLVAGGDGTVAWVLNTINKSAFNLPMIPPIGIIPLGTGNDLSRVLGWGKEYNNSVSPSVYLNKLSQSEIVNLDRWIVTIKNNKNLSVRREKHLNCYNYLSIGVDAKVALDFHQTRQTSSLYMPSRFLNKVLYTFFGTRQAVISDCNRLEKRVDLYLDGIKISNIPELESIVIVNIPSWAAGVQLWKPDTSTRFFLPQRIDDGRLEVVGLYSSFHIAQLQIGLSEPYYIGQAREIKIFLHDVLPMQIDGEPWVQRPAEITVTLQNQAKVLKVPF